jgi:hypothetical protein
LAEDLYLITREVKLISNKENLIKWEFTIFVCYCVCHNVADVSMLREYRPLEETCKKKRKGKGTIEIKIGKGAMKR